MELVERIAKLNVSQALIRALSRPNVQKEIIRLNTDIQLFELGENSLGIKLSAVGGDYSPVTKQIKLSKGQPINRVTLKDTGEFHASFRVVTLPNGDFNIISNPIKDDTNLLEEWGEEVEGLNQENHQKVLKLLEETILRELLR